MKCLIFKTIGARSRNDKALNEAKDIKSCNLESSYQRIGYEKPYTTY